MDLKEFKNKIQSFDTIEEVHEEARFLLEKHEELREDLMWMNDVEQLTDQEIDLEYDEYISMAINEERGVLRDDATHDVDTIEIAVEELQEQMEKNRASFLYNYKENMKNVVKLEEELELCNEKIKTIFPYINPTDEELYKVMESVYDFNEKQNETKSDFELPLEYDKNLFISELDNHQKIKIEDVLCFKFSNLDHITEVDLYVEKEMEGTLLDVEDLITPKQMEVLFKTDKVYEKEMTREQGMEM